MYISYEDYQRQGGSLSESDFMTAEPKAEAELRYLTYINGDIFAKPDQAVSSALCVAIDLVAQAAQEAAARQGTAGAAGIKSESNDGYSVTYISDAQDGQTADQALRRRIYEAIRTYLLPTGWLRRTLGCRHGVTSRIGL